MAYLVSSDTLGFQPIDSTSTTKQHALGTTVRAVDTTNGEGQFIYLAGVASTVAGDLVIYDQLAGTTTRAITTSRGPVAVAMSANVAGQYGWYQLHGAASVKAGAVAANALVYATATAGTVDDAVVATAKVDGARFATADGTPAAGFAIVQMAHPSLNGNG